MRVPHSVRFGSIFISGFSPQAQATMSTIDSPLSQLDYTSADTFQHSMREFVTNLKTQVPPLNNIIASKSSGSVIQLNVLSKNADFIDGFEQGVADSFTQFSQLCQAGLTARYQPDTRA